MKAAKSSRLRDIFEIGQRALGCRQVNELRSEVVRLGLRAFEAETGVFFLTSGPDRRLALDQVIGNVQSRYVSQYRDYYHKLNPFPTRPRDNRSVFTSDQDAAYGKLTETEYYRDFLKPQSIYHGMSLFLNSADGLLGVLCFHRPETSHNFSADDQTEAELLAPLLAGALEKAILSDKVSIHERIRGFIARNPPAAGLMVLDRFLDPVFVNEPAIRMLLCPTGGREHLDSRFRLPDEIYRLLDEHGASSEVSDNAGVRCAYRRTAINVNGRRVSLRLSVEGDESGLPVHFLSLQEAVADELHGERKPFSFSKREMEVVSLVSQGLTNREVAGRLFVSEHTVEKHLKSIFRKSGARNRTKLARLAIGS